MSKPTSFAALFEFYVAEVKPIYARMQADGVLPTEILHEINAAFDHVSRNWTIDNESEDQAALKAYSHLKRSCLDAFKMRLKEISDQRKELDRMHTDIIDNGEFDKRRKLLWVQIRNTSIDARKTEGIDEQFEKWKSVFNLCEEFEQTYSLNPNIDWSHRKRTWEDRRKNLFWAVAGAVLGAVLGFVLK